MSLILGVESEDRFKASRRDVSLGEYGVLRWIGLRKVVGGTRREGGSGSVRKRVRGTCRSMGVRGPSGRLGLSGIVVSPVILDTRHPFMPFYSGCSTKYYLSVLLSVTLTVSISYLSNVSLVGILLILIWIKLRQWDLYLVQKGDQNQDYETFESL